jgi:hypothetical protein
MVLHPALGFRRGHLLRHSLSLVPGLLIRCEALFGGLGQRVAAELGGKKAALLGMSLNSVVPNMQLARAGIARNFGAFIRIDPTLVPGLLICYEARCVSIRTLKPLATRGCALARWCTRR